jgi:hypothetical protein
MTEFYVPINLENLTDSLFTVYCAFYQKSANISGEWQKLFFLFTFDLLKLDPWLMEVLGTVTKISSSIVALAGRTQLQI